MKHCSIRDITINEGEIVQVNGVLLNGYIINELQNITAVDSRAKTIQEIADGFLSYQNSAIDDRAGLIFFTNETISVNRHLISLIAEYDILTNSIEGQKATS